MILYLCISVHLPVCLLFTPPPSLCLSLVSPSIFPLKNLSICRPHFLFSPIPLIPSIFASQNVSFVGLTFSSLPPLSSPPSLPHRICLLSAPLPPPLTLYLAPFVSLSASPSFSVLYPISLSPFLPLALLSTLSHYPSSISLPQPFPPLFLLSSYLTSLPPSLSLNSILHLFFSPPLSPSLYSVPSPVIYNVTHDTHAILSMASIQYFITLLYNVTYDILTMSPMSSI